MYEKPLRNRSAVSGRADARPVHDTLPLTDTEIEELTALLRDSSNPAGDDLLTFSGARSAAGLITRIVFAEPAERATLVTAVRRVLAASR